MRVVQQVLLAIAAATTLAACNLWDGGRTGCDYKGHHHRTGEVFPDWCNACTCRGDGTVVCTEKACGRIPDARASTCGSTPTCEGPECGAYCCSRGERCVNDVCMCGNNPACAVDDECAAAGPVGGDACGSICCGASGPCPQ